MSYFKLVNGVEVEMTPQEIENRQAEEVAFEQKRERLAWNDLRSTRNKLLAECDWTQGRDIPDGVASAWASYRQGLRDLPQNTTDPLNPVWPVKPE